MDSRCVSIGQQVCFDVAMKHENEVSDEISCLPVIKFNSLMKEIKLCALYIGFLFVKSENDYFIKEIIHVFRAFIDRWKFRQRLWKILSRWKTLGFSLIYSWILPKVRLSFHQDITTRRKCLISKILNQNSSNCGRKAR